MTDVEANQPDAFGIRSRRRAFAHFEKVADEGSINMEGFLAVIDYDKPLTNEETITKCPMNSIVKRGSAEPARQKVES